MDRLDTARLAELHTEAEEEYYSKEIDECEQYSHIITGVNGFKDFPSSPIPKKHIENHIGTSHKEFPTDSSESKVSLMKCTTTDALSYIREQDENAMVILLNFASYKDAGGRFLDGSMAQEEALCHDSFLYNVLRRFPEYYEENNKHLNKGMYFDRAIYSPDVIFNNDKLVGEKADVITCACPNKIPFVKYNSFTEEENHNALKERILFLRDILYCEGIMRKEHNPYIILGAWGCGVFRQDAKEVAELFKKVFENTGINIIYAIPDDRNFKAFEDVFGKDKVIDTGRSDKEQKEINQRTKRSDNEWEI